MTSATSSIWRGRTAATLAVWLLLFQASSLWAADPSLEGRLIWGTNGKKPAEADFKDLDKKTRAKLCGVFRWTNYFEVSRVRFEAPVEKVNTVRMSSKCRLEIQSLTNQWIEVKLFGEEKLVVKKRQLLRPDELLTLAGDDKGDAAWFVILSRVEPEK